MNAGDTVNVQNITGEYYVTEEKIKEVESLTRGKLLEKSCYVLAGILTFVTIINFYEYFTVDNATMDWYGIILEGDVLLVYNIAGGAAIVLLLWIARMVRKKYNAPYAGQYWRREEDEG